MTAAASRKMTDEGVFYVGMPLTGDDTTPIGAVVVELKQKNGYSSAGYGLFAFIVGAILACFGWTFNRFCSIASLLVLGEFAWTFESAWKHVLVSGLGSAFTAVAFWAVFKMIFPTVLNDDDDDEDDGPSSHKRDISDALQDLGELGFMAGFCGAQTFFVKLVCNHLDELGIMCEQSSTALNGLTLIFVMSWMLCAKMRDYIKAVNRLAKYDDRSLIMAREIVQNV